MPIETLGEIAHVEVIAVGSAIHQLVELEVTYGTGQWRKLKGVALVRLPGGSVRQAEIHWYEAHGIGRKRMKIKRFLD